jgi:curli biogenesis system outer membrane secretion channel CsgG
MLKTKTIYRSPIRLPLVFAALALTGACSTSTQSVTNTLPTNAPEVSPVIAQSMEKALKRKVAIARFSNETKHGNSFLLDKQYDRVGKQAMDILSARLTETGKFLMLERADLAKLESERALTEMNIQDVGADYLIVGSVSEFGRNTTSEVGIFSRNRKQEARAKVNVRLIDVRSGEIIYAEEGAGTAYSEANSVFGVGEKAGYDGALDDQALSAAISKLTSNIVGNLLDQPWNAYVLGEQDGFLIISGGRSQGIKVGDRFLLEKKGKTVKNQQTGLMLTLPGKTVGEISVSQLLGSGSNEVSLCTIESGAFSAQDFDQLIVKEMK